MARGVGWYLVPPLMMIGLLGCRFSGFEEREPWRAEAEEQCVAQQLVRTADYLEPTDAVNGKGTCGMTKPFKVAAVSGGFVEFKPKATLSCPLVANVDAWFHEAIQPAALAWYGSPVIEIKQISAYSCRTMNGQPGAAISEHAFGNALDIAAFRFADGREVEFKTGWKGRPEERGFLRAVHAAACERFSTVLAPGSNVYHYDHIHVDLARRASGRSVCEPEPMNMRPPAQPMPNEIPVARGPSAQPPMRATQIVTAPSRSPATSSSRSDSTSPWVQQGPAQKAVSAPSPWAHQAPQTIQAPVERGQPVRAAAGQPMVLGTQPPASGSFSQQAPLAERVRQALGTPAPAPMQAPPAGVLQPPPPAPAQNPYGLVPPGRIPNARSGADPVVTGSVGSSKNATSSAASPQSFAEEKPNSEATSVFDLQRANRLAQ
jgi:hypothetical protein